MDKLSCRLTQCFAYISYNSEFSKVFFYKEIIRSKMLVEEEPPPENEENMDIEISKSTNNQFKIESFLCQREIGSVKSVVKTFVSFHCNYVCE